jgi:repressor LexA
MIDSESKKAMARNIQYYLDLQNKDRNDLCRALDLPYTTVSNWLQGVRYPRIDKIEKMAQYFNVPVFCLIDKNVPRKEPPVLKQRKIPLLGKVAAGEPIYADDHVEGYEYIDSKYNDDGFEYFALRVSGHSMEPTIKDGDIVIVRQQDTVDSGQIAIVLVAGEDATAKEVRIDKSGITLVGHNLAVYTPQFYTNAQVVDLPVTIIGLVIEVRHKLI